MTKVSDYIASVIGPHHPFVVQGGAAVHVIDSLARQGHKYVCCAHEQAAGMAADGYAKMTGFGVAVTTCGPGATNLLTAAACAFHERVPVLYIVGQQDGFQNLDVVGMFKSVTKFAEAIVSNASGVNHLLNVAVGTAIVHGPALLNIHDNIYRAEITDILPLPGYMIGPQEQPPHKIIFAKQRSPFNVFMSEKKDGYVDPYFFMDELERHEGQVVTDIGNHGVWTLQALAFRRSIISDNNFGAMGYALPAAMGVACAGKQAICITGDGAIQMNIQELATIAKHEMDVKIFVLNNNGYGMIRNTQDTWLEGRHSGCDMRDLPQVDFERIATAYGIPNRRWDTDDDINFADVLAMKGPVLVNVAIDPDQKVK